MLHRWFFVWSRPSLIKACNICWVCNLVCYRTAATHICMCRNIFVDSQLVWPFIIYIYYYLDINGTDD